MNISFVAKGKSPKVDFTVVPYWEGAIPASLFTSPDLKPLLEAKDFQGKSGETALFYPKEGGKILLLGLGKKGKEKSVSIRRAYANAWKLLIEKKGKNVHLVFPKIETLSDLDTLKTLCGGALLSNYAFDRHKSEKVSLVEQLFISGAESKLEKEIDRLQIIAAGVYFIRDLVNGNAHDVGPSRLAKEAQDFSKKNK
ncbi:MAG: hypothetical protein HY324_02820, partial [Chlamydiia bacterium]|nr:hypothetical protein [Chlamydiia bacterium]